MSAESPPVPSREPLDPPPGWPIRIARTLASLGLVVVSLLVFPGGIALLVIGWMALVTVALRLDRPTVPSVLLFGLGGILLIKQPEQSERFYILITASFYSGCMLFLARNKRTQLIELSVLWLLVGWFVWGRFTDASSSQPRISLADDACVVCLGDSLTEGGYPAILESLIDVPVQDFGRNGCTAREAIIDLLPAIEEQQPRLVVVELGGHDYKDGTPRQVTKRRLNEIIQRVAAYGGEVILVEIPRGFIRDPYGGLERELAREHDLQVIPDTIIRRFILSGPNFPPGSWLAPEQRFSEDNLHPNSQGSEAFARVVAAAINQRVKSDP